MKRFCCCVLTLSLFCAAEAGARTCTLESRLCAAVDSTGRCVRWDNTFRCFSESADKDRCAVTEDGPLASCTAEPPVCTSTDGGLCLETSTDLVCREKPSGPGITAGKPVVSIAYETARSGTLPEGCTISAEVCRDDAPRDVPVSNLPGETVTASPPCWEKALTVSCPSDAAASSCQALEAAGCVKLSDPVCEVREGGVCLRWSSTYRCRGSEVTGGDIETDGSETIPGDPTEDRSACESLERDAASRGLVCRTDAKTCVEPAPEGSGLPCLVYETAMTCSAPASDGCLALKGLADSGDCRASGPSVCTERASDGTCLAETQSFVCRDAVADADVLPALPTGTESVPDYADADACLAPEAATGMIGPVPRSVLSARAAAVDLSGCVKTASSCTDGPGIRFVNGRPEYRSCWTTEETWTCQSSAENECGEFEKNPQCELVSEACSDGSDDCLRPSRVYRCTKPGASGVIGEVCDEESCIAGVCRPTGGTPSEDFVSAVVQLEIGRQAGVYGDVENNRFFSGQVSSCKDRKGATSCCRAETVAATNNAAFGQLLMFGLRAGVEYVKYVGSPYVYDALAWSDKTAGLLSAVYGTNSTGAYSPSFSYWGVTATYSGGSWAFSFSPTGFLSAAAFRFYGRYSSCDAGDQKTSMAKGQRLCHFVGTTCEKRVAGLGCVETVEKHVCFNSRLARIINEQGRPQIGRDFGTPVQPDARGFTIEELQQLDFSRMDLSEFTADVIREAAAHGTISAEEASRRASERIAAMVNGELARTAAVPGAQAVTAAPGQPVDPSGTGGTGSASSQPLPNEE